MKMYAADSYWQTASCSCHSVFYGSFEECLDFVIHSYIGSKPLWSIHFGEYEESFGLFFPERLVARSSDFRTDYNDLY